LFDRLISGAGAVSHLAGRLVRAGGLGQRMASLLIAGVLALAALGGFVFGIGADDGTLRTFNAGELATGDHGDRTFATVSGSLASTYVTEYRDDNADGQQQPTEVSRAWHYFLVDETSKGGITVESARPPSEVYTYRAQGIVVEDPTYLREDLDYFKTWLDGMGITLDPLRYVDATKPGGPTKVGIADGLPVAGTPVEVEGSRSFEYLPVCSSDTNEDGVCAGNEIDLYDVIVYDPVSKKGVTVRTANSPEFSAAAFTGMLRRAPERVAEAQKTNPDEFHLSDFGITVSVDYLLSAGEGPAALGFLVPVAVVVAAIAVLIAIGALGGYLRFRPGGAIPVSDATLAPGERIPVYVTGELRAPRGSVHVREANADLVRFVMAPGETTPTPAKPAPVEPAPAEPAPAEAQPAEAPPAEPPPTTLIIERRGRPEGVAVGRGELTAMEAGSVIPLRGDRPALRLNAGTGPLLVSFGSVEERDRAAAELAAETGIG